MKQYALLASLGLGYLVLISFGIGLSCPIRAVTGIYCPGCGSTRSVRSILGGDFATAFHNNALLVASPLILGIALAIERYAKNKLLLYGYLTLVLVIVIIFTVLRNQDGSIFAPI